MPPTSDHDSVTATYLALQGLSSKMFTAGLLGVAVLVILIGWGAKGLSLIAGLLWSRKDRHNLKRVPLTSMVAANEL